MASKLSFLNSLMERKKRPKDNNKISNKDEELAFVKAAAWAWYQHGSGSKGKTTCEFNATISRRSPRPSRYKLEAMRIAKEAKEVSSPTHSKKLSLLDAYEVESISRQLNSLVENSNHNKRIFDGANNSTNASVDFGGGRNQKKKKNRKGFWLRHGAVCGREGDVVDPGALRDGGRRLPAKQVSAVNLAKCVPMASGAL